MNFNRNEHSSFVQRLDKAAEKNPLLWLPCVLMIVFALAGEHLCEYAKIAYSHRNTEKVIKEKPQLERKPPALRGVAVSLVIALSFMIMPDLSFGVSAAVEDLSVNVKSAYVRVLTGESGSADSFDLYDMDSDGIDELFVMYGADRGKLFTYNGSGVTLLGDLTAYGGFVMFDGKYLASYGELEETPKISVKRGDSLYCVMREFKDIHDDSDKSHYEVNGAEVGFEDFRMAMEPLMGMKREAVGTRYSLNAESIEAVLGAAGSEDSHTAYMSSNVGSNNYINAHRWTDPTYSYISEYPDGSVERVEYISGTGVVVERYSEDGNVIFQKVITHELPLFGGAFIGNNNNFLVFGQENRDQDNSVEVMRVVKYSKDWERLESTPFRGENTCVPFDGGSLRMDEAGDHLVIHTCHEMYKSSDGYNHQANMTFVINKSDMSIESSYSGIMNITYGYVSHSFNQFVKTDGSYIYRLDHGDANPRSVVLTKAPVTGVTLVGDKKINLLEISENNIKNDTGVSVGGFEMSAHGFIAAGNTIDQSNADIDRQNGQRNIFVAVSDSELSGKDLKMITNYDAGIFVGNPFLVKIDNTKFAVLWEETTGAGTVTKFAVVDDNGNVLSPVKTVDCRLSDCQPILTSDGNIMWYYTENSAPVFVKINTEGQPVTDAHIHDYGRDWRITDGEHYLVCECGDGQNVGYRHFSDYGVVTMEPTADTAGEMTYSCFVCGKFMHKEEIPPTEHEHEFGTEWKYDENGHWHECTACGGKSEIIPHNYETEVINDASETSTGIIKYSCTECDYSYTKTIPVEGHEYDMTEWKKNETDHWHECIGCGHRIDVNEHTFQRNVTIEPTDTTQGEAVYTCSECGYSFTKEIPPIGHEHRYDTDAWKYSSKSHWRECSCGEKSETAPHNYIGEVMVEPTETTTGIEKFTCTYCGYSYTVILPTEELESYTITIPENVIVTRGDEILKDGDTVKNDDVLNISVDVPDGYVLGSLIVNGNEIKEFYPYTYTVKFSDVIISVLFNENYTITIPNHVTVTRGNEILHDGDTVNTDDVLNISVDVPNGYVLGSLIVNGNEIKDFYPYTYTVKFSDVIVSVLFNENYTITIPNYVTVTRGNEILHDGDTVNTDDILNISVDVPDGYSLKSLLVNGNEISDFYPYNYTVKFGDVIIAVDFVKNNVHTHNLSSVYSYDKTGHWYACSGCDEKVYFALHTETSKVTVQPTTSASGERTYYCSVCGYVIRTEEIPSIPEIHTHTFGTSWKEDSLSHWHECVCGEKADIASHIENSGVITVQPTECSSGTKTYSCIVCGYTMRTETIPPTYVDPSPSYPSYPFIPDYPVYYPSQAVPSGSIEITLECDLNGISEGKVHFSTKKVFFRNSAIVRVTSTDAADEAASMAADHLRGGAEHNIIYPFDISVYDADTYEEIQLKERGYITLEIPVPDILSDKTNEISVYHIVDGKPELLKSRIVVKSGVNKIRFTADSFSPYMFAAYSETAMEDVSSAAGAAADSIAIDFAGPTTNGVGIPTARLPKIMEFSNKKRRYRILRKRRLDDLVFVY